MKEILGPMTDEQITEILGPKCGDCGWRRGDHHPTCRQLSIPAVSR